MSMLIIFMSTLTQWRPDAPEPSAPVEGRAAPMVDGAEALRSLRLVEAAKASAARGTWVKAS